MQAAVRRDLGHLRGLILHVENTVTFWQTYEELGDACDGAKGEGVSEGQGYMGELRSRGRQIAHCWPRDRQYDPVVPLGQTYGLAFWTAPFLLNSSAFSASWGICAVRIAVSAIDLEVRRS